jgi:hypothetical protein
MQRCLPAEVGWIERTGSPGSEGAPLQVEGTAGSARFFEKGCLDAGVEGY